MERLAVLIRFRLRGTLLTPSGMADQSQAGL